MADGKPPVLCYDGCGLTRDAMVESIANIYRVDTPAADRYYEMLKARWEKSNHG